MDGYSPCQLSPGKQPCKKSVAAAMAVVVALGVTVVVLAVALPTVLCPQGAGSEVAANTSAGLAQLEKALAVTNQSLAEAHWQWDECKKELGVLEGKASELEQALARVTQLQEENRVLKEEVAQQQKQLEDMQSSRDDIQLQNRLLEKQLQDMRSQYSGGKGIPAMSLGLLSLLLLLPSMLLL